MVYRDIGKQILRGSAAVAMAGRTVVAAVLIGSTVVGCGGESKTGQSIDVDGSSTVGPITMAVAEEFKKAEPSIHVNVGISGTGGGFKKFYANQTQISDASRPIKAKEAAKCKTAGIEYIELPVAYDGIAVVVNKKNNWCDHLTVAELKKIFEHGSQLDNWSQVRDGFPDVKLALYAPGRDSGTFDYFTKKINGKEGSGRAKNVTASEDDNLLVMGVKGNRGGLGYFGYAYYKNNKGMLKLLGIAQKGASPVKPSEETVEQGTYKPLSRPIFIYVRKDAYVSRPHVAKFVDYYMDHVTGLLASVGYMPLPAEVYELAKKRLAAKVTGSAFADKAAVKGKTLVDIYSR